MSFDRFSAPAPRRVRAFTLVELLVVVAIIALVAGLLIPAVASMRRAGNTAKCLSNLRQLQLAHWMYIQENDGRFIDVGLAHGGSHGNEQGAWINTLRKHYDRELVARSPADRSPHWSVEDGGDGVPINGTTDQFRRTSYGVNNFMVREAPADPEVVYDRLNRVKSHVHTVHFVMMAETGDFAGADHPHVENWWTPSDPVAPPILAANHLSTSIHGGQPKSWDARANYGFLDGHVETRLFSQVYVSPEANAFDPARALTFSIQQSTSR